MYNENGLRVQKTANGVVTDYTLHGKNIHHMTQGSDELHFFYDAQNKPAIVDFNGTKYAYVHNLQGDIVAILDSTGAAVVSYTYDAWGRPISYSGTMASTLGTVQPFRYRGYVYDEETGLYYLRSRYYNSHLCRFVNADSIISGNQYAYCKNSSVIHDDDSGFALCYCLDDQGMETNFMNYIMGGGSSGYSAIIATDLIVNHPKETQQEIDGYIMFCSRILATVYALLRPLSIEISGGVTLKADAVTIQNDCFYLDLRLVGLSKLGSKQYRGAQIECAVFGMINAGFRNGTEIYHPLLHETPCTCFPAFPDKKCPSVTTTTVREFYWSLSLESFTEQGFYIECSVTYYKQKGKKEATVRGLYHRCARCGTMEHL